MTKQITHFSSVLYSLSGSYFPQAVNYYHYKINKFRPHTWTTPIHWRTGCEVTVDRKLKMLTRVKSYYAFSRIKSSSPHQKKPSFPRKFFSRDNRTTSQDWGKNQKKKISSGITAFPQISDLKSTSSIPNLLYSTQQSPWHPVFKATVAPCLEPVLRFVY